MLKEEAEGVREDWAHVILGADSEPHPISFSNVRVGLDQNDQLVMAPYYVSNESFTLFNYGRQAVILNRGTHALSVNHKKVSRHPSTDSWIKV